MATRNQNLTNEDEVLGPARIGVVIEHSRFQHALIHSMILVYQVLVQLTKIDH
jgi:hypothetical protein